MALSPYSTLAQQAPDRALAKPASLAHAAPGGEVGGYTWQVIEAPQDTYGYEIHSGGKLMVRQTNVPGLPGMEGCDTPEQAATLAILVVEKLGMGHMPPTLDREEVFKVLGR